MAQTRELRVLITGDASKLDKSLKQTQTGLDKTQGHAHRLAGAMKVAGTAAAGALVVGLTKSVTAAERAEISQRKLETQLRASGVSYRAHAKEIDNVIQKTSRLSGLDDEDLQDSFTNIVRVTGDVNKALKLTGLAADFARAKHMDVAKAGELVGKVAGGNTGILSRYGIVLDKNATASEALATLQQKFSGQAAAYGKTTAGSMDRVRVASENVQEVIGTKLLPVVAAIADKFANLFVWLQRHDRASKILVGTIGVLVAALGTIMIVTKVAAAFRVLRLAVIAVNVAMRANPIGLVVTALAALAVGLVVAYRRSETFRNVVDGAFSAVKSAASSAWAVIRPVLQGMVRSLRGLIEFVSGAFTGDWRKAWAGIKDIAAGFASGIGRVIVKGVMAGMGQLGHQIRSKIVDSLKFAVQLGSSPVDIGKSIGNAIAKGVGIGDGPGKFIGGGFGGGNFGGSLKGARSSLGPFAAIGAKFGLGVSDGKRPAGTRTSSGGISYHSSGEAIDLADGRGPDANKLRFFNYMKSHFGGRLAELIYTPGGAGIKDGHPFQYTGSVAADHYDHVHVALDTGAPGVGDGPGRRLFTGDGIGQIESLWTRVGGRRGAAAMAAAIAMAESGGRPNAISPPNTDGSVDRGLWQINSVHGALSTTNRLANARAAVRISGNGRNWRPWTTYTSGAYRRFLGAANSALGRGGGRAGSGGGSAGMVGGTGSVTGTGFGAGANPNAVVGTGFGAGVGQFTPDPDFSPPTQLDYLSAAGSQAALTPGTADDLAAAQGLQSYYSGVYQQALGTGDPRIIGPAAESLKQATDAVTALTEQITAANRIAEERAAIEKEMVDNQRELIQLTKTQGPQLIAGLTAILSGGIGGKVGLGFQTPGFAGGGVRY